MISLAAITVNEDGRYSPRGRSRWTTAWSFVPGGSDEHLTKDTVRESCDRDTKLLSMNPMDSKHNQLSFVPEEKLQVIHYLPK